MDLKDLNNIEKKIPIPKKEDPNQKEKLNKKVQKVAASVALKSKKICRGIANFFRWLCNFVVSLFSPAGLIVIALIFLTLVIFTLSTILGPVEIKSICDSSGVPQMELLDKKEQKSAFFGYFTDIGVSKEVAAYLYSIKDKSKKGNEFISGADKEASIEDLIRLTVRDDTKSLVKMGAFRFSGTDAYSLLIKARDTGKDWTDEELQLQILREKISNEAIQENSPLKDSKRADEAIETIADLLGRSLTKKEKEDAITSAKEDAKVTDDSLIQCTVMGSGKGKSRLDGGTAEGSDFSVPANFAALDFTDIISFMNGIVSSEPKRPAVIGRDKSGHEIRAIDYRGLDDGGNYAAAKAKAEELGGEDTGREGEEKIYASCDRFVATVLKAMEIDISVPWGNAEAMHDHFAKSKCWVGKPIEQAEDGDVITWKPDGKAQGGHGHIAIYAGGYMYQASYRSKFPYKFAASLDYVRHQLFGNCRKGNLPKPDCRKMTAWSYNTGAEGCNYKSKKDKTIEELTEGIGEEDKPEEP